MKPGRLATQPALRTTGLYVLVPPWEQMARSLKKNTEGLQVRTAESNNEIKSGLAVGKPCNGETSGRSSSKPLDPIEPVRFTTLPALHPMGLHVLIPTVGRIQRLKNSTRRPSNKQPFLCRALTGGEPEGNL